VLEWGNVVGLKVKPEPEHRVASFNKFYPIQWLIRPLNVYRSPEDWTKARDRQVQGEWGDGVREFEESSVILRCAVQSGTKVDLSSKEAKQQWEDSVRFNKWEQLLKG
jgi:hypothetical protein